MSLLLQCNIACANTIYWQFQDPQSLVTLGPFKGHLTKEPRFDKHTAVVGMVDKRGIQDVDFYLVIH